ncbi:hypothetical protein BDZ90DRAFT_232534 [Jaminaea rosea]|uniref:Uncharacterized protein n=1 Tax=Jaminaea rosea TaxID=1569628 RepID=A0A316URG4_9BASI|nr:hypothetical protein BDZ90DRAFT_232534 [Jaminaea rosea]PWN27564.1 hypothetical protein BDZ90DRAFT_232534 [Jaminaea rosea]
MSNNDFNAAASTLTAAAAAPPVVATMPSHTSSADISWSSLLASSPESDNNAGLQNLAALATEGFRHRAHHDLAWRMEHMCVFMPDWRGILYDDEVEYYDEQYGHFIISPAWTHIGLTDENGIVRIPGALDGRSATLNALRDWLLVSEDHDGHLAWLELHEEVEQAPYTYGDLLDGIPSADWAAHQAAYMSFVESDERGRDPSSGGVEMVEEEEKEVEEDSGSDEELVDDWGSSEWWRGTGWSSDIERENWWGCQ